MSEQNVKTMTTRQLVDEYNRLTGKAVSKFSSRQAGEEQVRRARAATGHLDGLPEPIIQNQHQDVVEQPQEEDMSKHEHQAEANQAEANQAEAPAKKPLSEWTDEEVLAAAEKLAEKSELTLEDAQLEEAAQKIKSGKKRPGRPTQPKPELTEEEKANAKVASAEKRSVGVTSSWEDDNVRALRTSRAGAAVTWHSGGKEHAEEFDSVAKAFTKLGLPMNKHVPFRGKLRQVGKNSIEQDGVTYHFTVVEKSSKAA